MTHARNKKSSQGYVCCYLALYLVLELHMKTGLVICLHCLFSLANPNGGVAFHIYYSPLLLVLFSVFSDVAGVIWLP